MAKTIYDFTAIANNGDEFNFKEFEGKPILVVNTASKCGFTNQYEGLENLYKEFSPKGFLIVGFPCDQFAHQEPGSDEEIAQFCSVNFGVTFPLMKKIDVNGKTADPIFVWLKKQAPGKLGSSVKWNFTKFLVSSDGKTVKRYAPTVEPADIYDDIEKELS